MNQKVVSDNKKRRLPPATPKVASEGPTSKAVARTAPPKRQVPPQAVARTAPPKRQVPQKPSSPTEELAITPEPVVVAPPPLEVIPPIEPPSAEGGRITYAQLKEMDTDARITLFKTLNKGQTGFMVPIIQASKIPKQLVMRKTDAILREVISKTAPARSKGKIYYCPYCADYMPFFAEGYSGYDRCIGCSISTKDYYTRVDNQLFNKD